MSDDVTRLVSLLGGWPEYFGDAERLHGESLLTFLRRERVVSEVVFGMAVRYAMHRATFDKLSADIRDQDFSVDAGHFMSGKEQSRAHHENKVAALEKELLGTPYSRVKAGLSAQTAFDFEGDAPGPDGGGDDQPENNVRKIMPFVPLARKGARG